MKLKYLEAIMNEKKVSRNELAKAIDMNYVTLSKRLSGKVDLKVNEVSKIIQYLNLTDSEIRLCFFKS